jgi:DNA polymerase-3 subunit delta'
MSFADIKGQELAVKLLKRANSSGRMAHSYLFYGPQGVGKEFTAREFAKVLNCTEKKGDSCDKCSSCIRIGQSKHPDIIWVYPGGKSRVIKIEQVRKLQDFLAWRPYEGKIKVCVIVDAHTLKVEASNALLKTLEEPPNNSVLILVTDSPELLLPTIRSRMQGVQFFGLKESEVADILERKFGLDDDEAFRLSELSAGSISRAMIFKDENILAQRRSLLDMLAEGSLYGMKNAEDKIKEIQDNLEQFKEDLIAKLAKEHPKTESNEEKMNVDESLDLDQDEDAFVSGEYRRRVQDTLSLILSWYRDILVYKATKKEKIILNKDYKEKIKYWSEKFEEDELVEKVEVIDNIREGLSRQINFKLLFQVMFAQLGLV